MFLVFCFNKIVMLRVYNSREVVRNSGVKNKFLILVKVRILKNLFLINFGNDLLLFFFRVWSFSVKRLIKFFMGDDNCEVGENSVKFDGEEVCSLLVDDVI